MKTKVFEVWSFGIPFKWKGNTFAFRPDAVPTKKRYSSERHYKITVKDITPRKK